MPPDRRARHAWGVACLVTSHWGPKRAERKKRSGMPQCQMYLYLTSPVSYTHLTLPTICSV
eukprot:7442110-Alexandrium_andersonii.AAC.1